MEEGIRKVAVVGTGLMGTQIAILAVGYGYAVSVYDPDRESLYRSVGNIKQLLRTSGDKCFFPTADWETDVDKLKRCSEIADAVAGSDLVIEAASESIEVKREVFRKLDALAPRTALLATNSSSIPISRIEDATTRPELCVNLHFYQPAMGWLMVDVMGGTRTSPEAIKRAAGWVRSVGCIPLMLKKESLGFCFNRVWRSVKREVLSIWAGDVADFRDIDRSWMLAYRTPLGPFGMMDNIGLDVVYDVEMSYYNESKDPKDYPPEALKTMIDRKERGVKDGRGFYTYPDPEYSGTDFLKP